MKKAVSFSLWLILLISTAVLAERHGETRTTDDGELQAYNAELGGWVTPVQFWQAYVVTSSGNAWGRGTDYPPYDEVDELDTFMVEVDSGPCLMEFFHNRWRRANDVRRWDPAFNDYGGCPNVFD